jgi:hypothetical protein
MTVVDPTTAAIEAQIAERDLLRSENVHLGTALTEAIVERDRLVAEVTTLRRLLDAEKAQCDRAGASNLEAMAILGGTYPGGLVDRVQAVVAARDRARELVNEACAELYDTGGEFACKKADEILKELG